ncbi:MAG: DNA-protecting protein DprA [Ruminococcaceae bacterium]|nr:DNA-protecting protein DprA [Oscillospiraceae bacterium]
MSKEQYWLWLVNLPSISSTKITLLLERFETVEKIYQAQKSDFEGIDKIGKREIDALCNKDLAKANEIIKKLDEVGAYTLCFDDKHYPDMLRYCYEPPYVLYAMGEKLDFDKMLFISVVGSRECSDYGIDATDEICTELAQNGVVIVSGMARGIDSAAHRSALKAGAKTVAFLGCGIDVVYPPENDELMQAIAKNGMLITEFAPGTAPYSKNFPIRNRLIGAFSRGVLLVEAREKSGTLITANWALENGRDVFALPGDYNREGSAGCNELIKSGGAKLVMCAEDILEEYVYELENMDMGKYGRAEPVFVEVAARKQSKKAHNENNSVNNESNKDNKKNIDVNNPRYDVLDEKQKHIIELLANGDMHIDRICRAVDMSASEAAAALTIMELYGFVVALAGKMFTLNI